MHFYPNSNSEPLREFNSCHAPSGGSVKPGTFAQKGSAGCASSSPPAHEPHTSSLSTGDVVSSEPVEEGGANVALFVEVETAGGETVKAIYKPEIGEVWRGKFTNGDINRYLNNKGLSLAEREAIAYELDQLAGTDVVPETALRTHVDVEVDMTDSDDNYDLDDLQQQYDKWKEKHFDDVYEKVGDEMNDKREEEKRDYVDAEAEHGVDRDDAAEQWEADNEDWIGDHSGTEAQLLDKHTPSFTQWRIDNDFGGTGGRQTNDEAPHPNGGSLQRFIHDTSYDSLSPDATFRLGALDYLIGTMDRHPGNLLVGAQGKAYAIDNGYSLPDGPATFRSPAGSDLAYGSGNQMPEPLRAALHARVSTIDWPTFFGKHPAMNRKEQEWLLRRATALTLALETPGGLAELWANSRRM